LRTEAKKTQQQVLEENSKMFERSKRIAREAVLHGEYISTEKLKTMTIGEIIELISENE
jgi:hypothetical protein